MSIFGHCGKSCATRGILCCQGLPSRNGDPAIEGSTRARCLQSLVLRRACVELSKGCTMKLKPIALATAAAFAFAGAAFANNTTGSSSTGYSSPQSGSLSSQGNDPVRQVQQTLQSKGYNPGPVDGQFGRHTQTALKSFQKAQGSQATGGLDQPTLVALGVTQGSASDTTSSSIGSGASSTSSTTGSSSPSPASGATSPNSSTAPSDITPTTSSSPSTSSPSPSPSTGAMPPSSRN